MLYFGGRYVLFLYAHRFFCSNDNNFMILLVCPFANRLIINLHFPSVWHFNNSWYGQCFITIVIIIMIWVLLVLVLLTFIFVYMVLS